MNGTLCKNLLRTTLIVVFVTSSLLGCVGGNTNTNSNPVNNSIQPVKPSNLTSNLVSGPINYNIVAQTYDNSNNSQSGGNDGATSGVLLAFFPEAAPVLGPISAISTLIGTNKTSQQISQLTISVQTEQQQINNIENILNLDNNIFYQYAQNQAELSTNNWYYTYNQDLNAINGDDGDYTTYIGPDYYNTSESPSAIVSNPSNISNIANLTLNSLQSGATLINLLQDFSTANVPENCTNCYESVTQTVLASQGGTQNSATQEIYDSLYNELLSYIPQQNVNSSELSGIFESYNNQIISIYQKNVAAIQAAYTMEASNNYLNYLGGQMLGTNYESIPNAERSITSIYYVFTNNSSSVEATNLANAQQQLALLYAARFNMLYKTTMQYIVSDQPITALPSVPTIDGSSKWVVNANKFMQDHPYSQMVALNKTAKNIMGNINPSSQSLPTVNKSYVFYQYDGLNEVYTCGINASQGQTLTSSNCPALFPNMNQAVWNGQNFSAYVLQNGSPYLTGTIDPFNDCQSGSAQTNLTYYYGQNTSGNEVGQLQCQMINGNSVSGVQGFNANYGYTVPGVWSSDQKETLDISYSGFPSNVYTIYGQSFPINLYTLKGLEFTTLLQITTSSGLTDSIIVSAGNGANFFGVMGISVQTECRVGDEWCSQLAGQTNSKGNVGQGYSAICVGNQEVILNSNSDFTVNLILGGGC